MRVISLLKNVLPAKRRFDAPIAPDRAFGAIGDIHGCSDALEVLLAKLDTISPELPLVFVGDYVDRGPDSAGVLRRVKALEETRLDVICLKGNHEAMMLDFIDFPSGEGKTWLRNGGTHTLGSFGVDVCELSDDSALTVARDALVSALGEEMLHWLRARPVLWQTGNVAVTHAGGDPTQPLEPRRGHGLLWGHRDFLRIPRSDGIWMVHGHYIVKDAVAQHGRIPVDTGAYATGRLTAAIVEPGGIRFISS